MSEAELQHGFRSTLSARLWFWNVKTNSITLKQTITDNAGNTTTQTRVLTDTGCGSNNCGAWEDFDDTYIQGTNTATDFSIGVEVSNDVHGGNWHQSIHYGPDIDDIELNIQHNEITTTTNTVAASTSSSTATTSATTISYCWQQTPSTCADD